jgi:hypothetical protein
VPANDAGQVMGDRRARYAWLSNFRDAPDRPTALERYARLAPRYEASTARIRKVRARALDLLALQPGEPYSTWPAEPVRSFENCPCV